MFKWISELMSVVRFYQKDQSHLLDRIERLEDEVQILMLKNAVTEKKAEDGK